MNSRLTSSFILLFLLSMPFSTIFSQSDQDSIIFIAYWAMQDRYEFEVTKIEKSWKNAAEIKNDSIVYRAVFEVLDSTESSYSIKWSFLQDVADTYDFPQRYLDSMNNFQFTEVLYTTTELGEFVEIDNWKEISKIMKELFQDILDISAREHQANREALEEAVRPWMDIYSSEDGIESFLLQELSYLHYPFGYGYSVKDTLSFEEELPNFLGGDPILGDGILYFDKVDLEEEYCSFVYEMQVRPEEARRFLHQYYESTQMNDPEVKDLIDTSILDIRDVDRYSYYFDYGIPVYIETARIFTFINKEEHYVELEKVMIEWVE